MTIRRPSLATLMAVPIAAALLFSAYAHLDNGYQFLLSICAYRIVGPSIGVWIAGILPCLQIALGLVLIFDRSGRRTAFCFCTALFAAFVLVQISALVRDLNISCGCFGSTDNQPIGVKSIGLAASGFALSVTGIFSSRLPEGQTHAL